MASKACITLHSIDVDCFLCLLQATHCEHANAAGAEQAEEEPATNDELVDPEQTKDDRDEHQEGDEDDDDDTKKGVHKDRCPCRS